MNAVEIEEAVSKLAEEPFDPENFPFAFLEAFGNKATTIKRLKAGSTNKSDIGGGVLQRNNIHIAVCSEGAVAATLNALRESPETERQKAKFILATDGKQFEAEELTAGETVACSYPDFPDHFGFFLPLAGITTVKQIRENAFDIKATGRLNRLYIELLRENPDWGTEARRHDMNHFMARLIFCFFAEDTDIFNGDDLFTATIEQMSDRDSSNTHEVISEMFRAMDTNIPDRANAKLPRWANGFPYVNGGLFSNNVDVPRFTKIARSYLLHVGKLDWTKINPDIFGSMIQAVADDEERGALGMHYTSVPNILKVLNPLFLDELRERLDEAGDNKRKLLNLRSRIARIRVFDPACGSGNFLVIAYKEMRAIEAEINKRRGESHDASVIPLTNFRGIELRSFSAEIARLALIIAEFQCDVIYRGQKEALAVFLPLEKANWITCGNALHLDWLSICPSTGTAVKNKADDLFETPLDQPEIDFENEGGETYICGNPPYSGSRDQNEEQKGDLKRVFGSRIKSWKSLDYVTAWIMKAADYGLHSQASIAFVSTNSVCQGLQVPILWPEIFNLGYSISFAHTSFRWSNLASHNAGVTVVIAGLSRRPSNPKRLFTQDDSGETIERQCSHINAYLAAGESVLVNKISRPISSLGEMTFGNTPIDGGNLLLSRSEKEELQLTPDQEKRFVRRIYGSAEFIRGLERYCLWIEDKFKDEAYSIDSIARRVRNVREVRLKGGKTARDIADRPHQFQRNYSCKKSVLIVPSVSSENREYLPVGYAPAGTIVSNLAFALYDAPLWNMALIASKIHLVWISTVCGKLKTDFRYSNTLGWNTFPVPEFTEQNKADLNDCAEEILRARESYFPATIAELYDPKNMPNDLRSAHERNDEVLERIFIGRRFKNDTERLETLFKLYAKKASGKATA